MKASIRVLHLEAGKKLYGGAKQVTLLVDGIRSAHIQHYLACAEGSAIATHQFKNCKVLPITMHGDVDVLLVSRLIKIIKQHNIQLLHIHSRRGADLWGNIAAKIAGIPVVSTRRVDNIEPKLLGHLKFAKRVNTVAISQGVANALQQFTQLQNIPVIPSAVESKFFNLASQRALLHSRYGIPNEHKVIACFAQLIPRKGQNTLIEAMAKILAHYPDTHCLLFGKGKCLSEYQQQINAFNIQHRVQLPGFVDDIENVLPAIDIIAHPASAEGLGVILLQAGACQRPIVATRAGGIPEIVIDGQTGLLVEPEDTNALATRLMELLADEQKCAQLGERIQAHVRTNFSVERMCADYERLYNSQPLKP